MQAAPKQAAIAKQYGKPFWSVVADLHAEGMSPAEAAAALGYAARVFSALRARHPTLDPWPTNLTIAQLWEKANKESFEAGIQRLAKEYPMCRVSELMGFKSPTWLTQYIKQNDINVKFNRSRKQAARVDLPQAHGRTPREKSAGAVTYTRRQASDSALATLSA